MDKDQLSINVDPVLGKSIREAAAQAGESVSAWLAVAAKDRLHNDLRRVALETWEDEGGTMSATEPAPSRGRA